MKPLPLAAIAVLSLVILGSASGCDEATQGAIDNGGKPLEIPSEAADETIAQGQEGDRDDAAKAADEELPVFEEKNAKVKVSTTFGDIILRLSDATPKHRDNFLKLAEEGFYDGALFHRVIGGFMIQGGDPDSKGAASNRRLGNGGPGYTVDAEFVDSLVHLKGALAAARKGDAANPTRASSGSQFYIVQGKPVPPQMLLEFEAQRNHGKDSTDFFIYTDEQVAAYQELGGTPHLDGGYTVFGYVIEGLSIVDSIASVPVERGTNRPLEDVIMNVEVLEE